jgi:hypothetical protein
VASPLGCWLLLALAAPASTGGDREVLTDVLGCEIDLAAAAAAELLASPHPLVATATAVWTAARAPLDDKFERWRAGLPPEVSTGLLPDQADLDTWAREHTFGLIGHFPIARTHEEYLVLASALATKVSWQVPFDLAPARALGDRSPWTARPWSERPWSERPWTARPWSERPWSERLSRVLRTPASTDQNAHDCFVAATPEAGDVAVHVARAGGGLIVVSVIAQPEVPAGAVLAAGYRIGCAHAAGSPLPRRRVADLPLGDSLLWLVREENSPDPDACTAVLPAWSAQSEHNLDDPALGFAAAKNALSPDPWQAKQSAMARYSRTGFEAAAVSALATFLVARPAGRRRVAELRFGHPYAVVAVSLAGNDAWRGLPVFSAWVAEPEDPAD